MKNINKSIVVETTINAPVEKVWEYWTLPEHITKWNAASEDWHTPRAENDLRVGGKFLSRMEARDGSMGFDFGGIYDEVKERQTIRYHLADDRKIEVRFEKLENSTKIIEQFDAESENTLERQRFGWQSILDNFKKYAESII